MPEARTATNGDHAAPSTSTPMGGISPTDTPRFASDARQHEERSNPEAGIDDPSDPATDVALLARYS